MQESPPPRAAAGPVAEVHRIGDEVKVIAELPGAHGRVDQARCL